MGVKDKLLNILSVTRGTYISGEEIAKKCGTSRAAVWKAAQSLIAKGYKIDAMRNKGYALLIENDVITKDTILKYADVRDGFIDPIVYDSVGSTNDIAKRLAAESNVKEGTLIVANVQSAGRGRGSHTFFSPADSGLYMSLVLRPLFSASEALTITTAAAVAVASAIDSVRELCPGAAFSPSDKAEIKWVNDIFIADRKVCGILTEAAINIESGGLEYAVLGIGINVFLPKESFPADISDTAGAIFSSPCGIKDIRSVLIGEIIKNFRIVYEDRSGSFYAEYKRRSSLLGKEITVLADQPYDAVAIDIDRRFHLIARKKNGTIVSLSSGEVSVKRR